MKVYNYLLFRIYSYYKDYIRQNEKNAIFSTTVMSSFFVYFIFFVIITYIDFYFIKISDIIFPNKIFIIFYMLFFTFINYIFFIKNKGFIKYNFIKDKTNGYLIILFIFFIAFSFIFIANKNRDKILKERDKFRSINKSQLMIKKPQISMIFLLV